MSESAHVTSVEAIQDFRAALAAFGSDAQEALTAASMLIRHTFDWLQDQLKGWQREVYKRQEEVARARAALAHARALKDSANQRGGCTEQELELKKAQLRLREAEEKVLTVRRWQHRLPEAVREYEGPARQLSGMLDADLRQSLALLESKVATLEAYAALAPPGSEAEPSAAPEAEAAPVDAPPEGEGTPS